MALSKENISKLCMTGIYKCQPVLEWLESWRRDEPYHCINWTFKVRYDEDDDTYYMVDTYWGGSGGLHVELTDEIFDRFEFLFDTNEVEQVPQTDFWDYDEKDRWHVALDSAGIRFSRYYLVRKGAKKNKTLLLERLNYELDSLKRDIERKEEEIRKAMAEA